MGETVESEQICINCKGSGKKFQLDKTGLFVTTFLVIDFITTFVHRLDWCNGIFEYINKSDGFYFFAIVGVALLVFDTKKTCPTCNGKGRTTTTTTTTTR